MGRFAEGAKVSFGTLLLCCLGKRNQVEEKKTQRKWWKRKVAPLEGDPPMKTREKGRKKLQNWKLRKNKVAPLPLEGHLKIQDPKENENVILRQLEEDGIVAKISSGGVAFDAGGECRQFNISLRKRPRRLPSIKYNAEEKMIMAGILKAEHLKQKSKSAKTSEEMRRQASARRIEAHQKKVERFRAKERKRRDVII